MELTPTGNLTTSTLEPIMRVRTNQAGIRRILDGLSQAREQLEALKLEAPDDLAASIAPIEASVPWEAIDDLQDVTA